MLRREIQKMQHKSLLATIRPGALAGASFLLIAGMSFTLCSPTRLAAQSNSAETALAQTLSASSPGSCVQQANANSHSLPAVQKAEPTDAFAITTQYVEHFYPLWFTYLQWSLPTCNHLFGPSQIGPINHVVAAPDNDTIYANAVVNVQTEPVIVTIPPASANYSILALDAYGDIFESGIPAATPGKFAFTSADWSGKLPSGVTALPVPVNFFGFIVRIDNYSAAGMNQMSEAAAFRASLRLASLSEYLADPASGATRVIPTADFATSIKGIADTLIVSNPALFLTILQRAVMSATTPKLSPSEQVLSEKFNYLFDSQNSNPFISAGAQLAHSAIIADYLGHVLPHTTWINFANIGNWGNTFLDRSAITEYIQYGSGADTAAYYQTFVDNKGAALDGKKHTYVLTFPQNGQPAASRFWSLTAYLPQSITLVPNRANTYLVARYTPGLVTEADGSVSIYMAAELPPGVPLANWLPVPSGPFNVMLRDYGPMETVTDGTYVPPPVSVLQ